MIVIVLEAQEAATPAGKLLATPIPVAPVVLCVTLVIVALAHNIGLDKASLTVLLSFTVTVAEVQEVVLQVPSYLTK